ncbi:MAG: hypothetical protein OEY07_02965 [Gammaproteobacteria bacterium]|nr:hypothetical protein [Gammaproteobacteria bacterium]
MADKVVFSLLETPLFPDFSRLFQRLGYREQRFDSTRKAISALKTQQPDLVLGEFVYGYGNNYAGVNICNLDVFLYSLQKYAPAAGVIVLVEKGEREYAAKLADLFDLQAILTLPVTEQALLAAINSDE